MTSTIVHRDPRYHGLMTMLQKDPLDMDYGLDLFFKQHDEVTYQELCNEIHNVFVEFIVLHDHYIGKTNWPEIFLSTPPLNVMSAMERNIAPHRDSFDGVNFEIQDPSNLEKNRTSLCFKDCIKVNLTKLFSEEELREEFNEIHNDWLSNVPLYNGSYHDPPAPSGPAFGTALDWFRYILEGQDNIALHLNDPHQIYSPYAGCPRTFAAEHSFRKACMKDTVECVFQFLSHVTKTTLQLEPVDSTLLALDRTDNLSKMMDPLLRRNVTSRVSRIVYQNKKDSSDLFILDYKNYDLEKVFNEFVSNNLDYHNVNESEDPFSNDIVEAVSDMLTFKKDSHVISNLFFTIYLQIDFKNTKLSETGELSLSLKYLAAKNTDCGFTLRRLIFFATIREHKLSLVEKDTLRERVAQLWVDIRDDQKVKTFLNEEYRIKASYFLKLKFEQQKTIGNYHKLRNNFLYDASFYYGIESSKLKLVPICSGTRSFTLYKTKRRHVFKALFKDCKNLNWRFKQWETSEKMCCLKIFNDFPKESPLAYDPKSSITLSDGNFRTYRHSVESMKAETSSPTCLDLHCGFRITSPMLKRPKVYNYGVINVVNDKTGLSDEMGFFVLYDRLV